MEIVDSIASVDIDNSEYFSLGKNSSVITFSPLLKKISNDVLSKRTLKEASL